MIYPLSGLLLGAIIGAIAARRRGGQTADLLQWAAVGGLIFAVIGLFLLVFIERSYT